MQISHESVSRGGLSGKEGEDGRAGSSFLKTCKVINGSHPQTSGLTRAGAQREAAEALEPKWAK